MLVWCASPLDVFATVAISTDRSCQDETYPLVDGSECFRHQFNPVQFGAGDVWWLRGQASATGVDGWGNTFRFDHWSISGATNSEGTCQEGSTNATCTVSFVPNSGQIHMTAVYELVPPPGDALVFSGFAQPLEAYALNVAKAGRTIPLKWRVTDENGLPVTDLTSVSVGVTSLVCALGDTSDQVEEYASGESGLQNLGDDNYQYNWTAPKAYASSCKTLNLDLGDGANHTADFQFVK